MNNYYELRPCKPKVAKLKKLLEENMYSGKECEEDEQHQGHKVRVKESSYFSYCYGFFLTKRACLH